MPTEKLSTGNIWEDSRTEENCKIHSYFHVYGKIEFAEAKQQQV